MSIRLPVVAIALAGLATAWAQPLDLRSRISSSQLKRAEITKTEKALESEAARLREAETALLNQAVVSDKVRTKALAPKKNSMVPKKAPKMEVAPEATSFNANPSMSANEESHVREIKLLEAAHEDQKKALKIQVRNVEKKNQGLVAKIRKLQEENNKLRKQVANTKSKTKSELQKVDDLHVRLMVAETQVERLNKIIEKMGGTPSTLKRKYNSGARQKTAYPSVKGQAVAPLYATVTALKANVRTGPGISNSRVTTLSRGQRVLVETKQGNWYKVLLDNGMKAWVNEAGVRIVSGGGMTAPIREPRLEDVDDEALRLLEQLKR